MSHRRPSSSDFGTSIPSFFDLKLLINSLFTRVDVLQRKMRPYMAVRTKLVVSIGASLILLAIPGVVRSQSLTFPLPTQSMIIFYSALILILILTFMIDHYP